MNYGAAVTGIIHPSESAAAGRAKLGHRKAFAMNLVAMATILVLICCAAWAAGQRRAQLQVTCVVLPHISLQLNGQKPVYDSMAATVVTEPGQIQLMGNTNDPNSSEFVLTVSASSLAVVNGLEVAPGHSVEVGRCRYGAPVMLTVTGIAPIHLTASR